LLTKNRIPAFDFSFLFLAVEIFTTEGKKLKHNNKHTFQMHN